MLPIFRAIRFLAICWGPVVLAIAVAALIAHAVTTQPMVTMGGAGVVAAVVIGFVLGFIVARRRGR